MSQPVKFYLRYPDYKTNDDWSVGSDQWDAILVTPKETVIIFGVGVFQQYPRGLENFDLKYKWNVSGPAANVISNGDAVIEPVEYKEELISNRYCNIVVV